MIAAVPADDPLPEPRKLRAGERDASPLERAAGRVAADLRAAGKAAPEAIEYLLYLHALDGRAEDLDRAREMIRVLREQDPEGAWVAAAFRAVQAGGGDRADVEERFMARREAVPDVGRLSTADYAGYVLEFFARAAAFAEEGKVRDALLAAASCLERRSRSDGVRLEVVDASGSPSEALIDHVQMLAMAEMAAALSGSPVMRDDAARLARGLDRRFWDGARERYRVPEVDASASGEALRRNALAARLLWSVGYVSGDAFLKGRGKRVLDSVLEEAVADPVSAPAAGLAAARISRYPVQMVLIGEAGDPLLGEMRRTCFFLFEPRRVMLNLDPVVDAARFEELLYPADLAPVLFVCVESICSAPIKTPDTIGSQVKLILAQSAGVPE